MSALARLLLLVFVAVAALATLGDRAPAASAGQPCPQATITHTPPSVLAVGEGCAHAGETARMAPSLCAALCLGWAVLAAVMLPALPPLVGGRCPPSRPRSVPLLHQHPDPRPPQRD